MNLKGIKKTHFELSMKCNNIPVAPTVETFEGVKDGGVRGQQNNYLLMSKSE